MEFIHGKLTVTVRYRLRYADGDKPVFILGLGPDVPVNSIIGILTLHQWSGSLDFANN